MSAEIFVQLWYFILLVQFWPNSSQKMTLFHRHIVANDAGNSDRLSGSYPDPYFAKQRLLFVSEPAQRTADIWSEWRLTVIAATVRIALVDILDLSEVDIPAGVFLHPAVGWG